MSELNTGTDPNNEDTDGDGISDGDLDVGTEFYAYKAAHFDANRDGYFH